MLSRLRAAGWHLLISCSITLMSAALVFVVWYPGQIERASGVRDIYLMMLAVDTTLGPVITLVIFNTIKKSKWELRRDLGMVGTIQILALLYGLYTVFIARPVFIVYNAGRFDVAYANDFDEKNLALGTRPEYRSLSVLGPVLVASVAPTEIKARNKLLFDSLSGGLDLPLLPQFFEAYAGQTKQVIAMLQPISLLREYNSKTLPDVDSLIKRYADAGIPIGFMALKGKSEDLTVVISRASGEILEYVPLAPWR